MSKRVLYLNVYASGGTKSHNNRESADLEAKYYQKYEWIDGRGPTRIACIRIEFEEGEGLGDE